MSCVFRRLGPESLKGDRVDDLRWRWQPPKNQSRSGGPRNEAFANHRDQRDSERANWKGAQRPCRSQEKGFSGNKPIETVQPGIHDALEALVDPVTRGEPMSLLRWTLKSRRVLAADDRAEESLALDNLASTFRPCAASRPLVSPVFTCPG
jgi:hypothetical protein